MSTEQPPAEPTGPYSTEACNQFVQDMTEAGIPVEHYRGRHFWEGPAVRSDEDGWPSLQDIHRATKVKVQRENLAFDWIVYPVQSGELIHPELMPDFQD